MHLGHGSETKFDVNVHKKERLIRKAVVVYLGAASEFTGNLLLNSLRAVLRYCAEPEITLVLSPITSTPRQEERSSRFIGM